MTRHPIGFDDPAAARAVVRRLRLRRGLVAARASITGLLNRLDQASEADRDRITAAIQGGITLAESNRQRGVRSRPVHGVECQHVREQELLQGVDLLLQLLNSLDQGLAHGCFSSIRFNAHEATSAEPAAHRLCDEPSHT